MDPAARFAELINQPAASAHLDLLCGLIGEAVAPECTVDAVLRELDALADMCEPTFEGILDGLFASGLFGGDVEQYHAVENSLLQRVIERRVGMPITLSVVCLEVGRRLGVPILGIGLPGHFVVRDARSQLYGDPFAGGLRYDQQGMLNAWALRVRPPTMPSHVLTPVSNRQLVLRILNNLQRSVADVGSPIEVRAVARLRSAYPELAAEQPQWLQAMRHWN